MERRRVVFAVSVVLAFLLGVLVGFLLTMEVKSPPPPPPGDQEVTMSGHSFSCGPSSEAPYLEGALQFNLTSTYSTPVVAEVAYVGDWTGDTDQEVQPGSTKHVVVTWGPGKNSNIREVCAPSEGQYRHDGAHSLRSRVHIKDWN